MLLCVRVCAHIRERVVNTSRPGEMQVTIQNLMPDTKYRFRVVAHNSNGQGESSAALKVATQAEGEDTHTHAHIQTFIYMCSANRTRKHKGELQPVCWKHARTGTLRQTGCTQKQHTNVQINIHTNKYSLTYSIRSLQTVPHTHTHTHTHAHIDEAVWCCLLRQTTQQQTREMQRFLLISHFLFTPRHLL